MGLGLKLVQSFLIPPTKHPRSDRFFSHIQRKLHTLSSDNERLLNNLSCLFLCSYTQPNKTLTRNRFFFHIQSNYNSVMTCRLGGGRDRRVKTPFYTLVNSKKSGNIFFSCTAKKLYYIY